MKNSDRLALNSIIIYGRIAITTILKLITTRLLVLYLGLEDYGLYNLLAGIVLMLSFLKATLASTSQRFLSISIGKNNLEETTHIYSVLTFLHIIFALFILIVVDVIGTWMIECFLNIPEGKEWIATIVMHTIAITIAINIQSVPMNAILLSHENLLIISFVLILESIFTLTGVAMLQFVSIEIRLKLYAYLVMFINIFSLTFLFLYTRKYKEVKIKIIGIKETNLWGQILKYIGWSTLSSFLFLIRNQGYAILFNVFGGVIVNSAYAIANQINALISYTTEAIIQPLRPQVISAYGAGYKQKSIDIVLMTTKIIICIATLVIVPTIVYVEEILIFWLSKIPEYACDFCRILLLSAFVFLFSNGIKSLIEATGKVKKLFMVIGYLHLGTIIIAIVIVLLGGDFIPAFTVLFVEDLVGTFYRIRLANKTLGINLFSFYTHVFLPGVSLFLFSWGGLYLIKNVGNIYIDALSIITFLLIIFFIYYSKVLNNTERNHLRSLLTRMRSKVYRVYYERKK